MQNFTVADTPGILKACLALFLFCVRPRIYRGWALNLFEFRQGRLMAVRSVSIRLLPGGKAAPEDAFVPSCIWQKSIL
jgi:hypothetical protein